jgi:ribonuclease HII
MEPATGEAEETQAAKGRRYVAGMDEAGRGSWAGPLVAAATLMDTQVPAPLFKEARDSKSFTVTKDRKDLAEKFKKETPYGVGAVTASEISGMNLDDANKLAFKRALADLVSKGHKVDALLVDGANIKFQDLHSDTTLMIRGESVSQTIAAASIIAKVRHDEIMLELSELYPEFQFDRNQGYGTGGHDRLLDLHGPSPEHRMSFKPVKDAAKKMALLGRPLMTSRTPAPPLPPPQELQF